MITATLRQILAAEPCYDPRRRQAKILASFLEERT